ncbi:MAG: translocation/assembly module TamB domain-containing protein [Nostochopsis sp.]
MTGSPTPENQPPSNSNRRFWLLLLSRTGITLGVILLVGIAGGAWWAWTFINKKLTPLVETNLEQLVGRPIQVGKVEDFSWNSLRFGSSSLPATATDPDNLKIKAIQVQFDPWQVIRNRTLKLNVALVQPDIYIAQDQQGRWVTTTIKLSSEQEAGFIQTELENIQIQGGDITLQPFSQAKKPKAAVGLIQINGSARFLEQNQLITFKINTTPVNGGDLQIVGNTRPSTGKINLKINAADLLASDLSRLVETPVDVQAGRVDSDLTVQLQSNQPEIALFGSVGLNQITAQVANIPTKITNTTGQLNFQNQQIALENLTTLYGSIPVQAQGTINTQTGYNLTAQVKPVNLKTVLDSLNAKSPVPVAGTVQANIKVQGSLEKPIATGNISTVKTAQIDRLIFNQISTNLRLTPNELVLANIQVTPNIGGKITGSGRVALGNQNRVAFNLQGQNLPGDAIAKTYEASPQIQIGNLAVNTQISGIPSNLKAVAQVQAPAATYPARLEVAINSNNSGVIRLQDAVAKIAGGTITARGQLVQKRWQGVVDANNIQLNNFTQVPPQYREGVVNGEFNLAGITDSFELANIQATGQARLNLAESTVNIRDIQLNNGNWQAVANASRIPLSRVVENIQGQIANANLRLSGTTNSFELADIQAGGQASVNVASGTLNLDNIRLKNGRWQTVANANQIQLDTFSENLRGQLSGQVGLTGTVASFEPSAIQANGQIRLSQGLDQLQQPLTTQFQWNGEQLRILQATTPGLRAAGTVAIAFADIATPQIQNFNLDILAQNYNLQTLPFNLPGNVAIAGTLDFDGTVTGTPSTPVASGKIQLENFKINQLAFDPVLTGQVNYQPEPGTQLQLRGRQDQIAFNLDPNYRPTSFLVRRDRTVATGRSQGDNLLVNLRDFPLSVVEGFIPGGAKNFGPVAGNASGNFVVNFNESTLAGNVNITQPQIGRLTADLFRGQIGFADSVFSLSEGELRQGTSRYLLSGKLPITGNQPLDFQLSFDQARIENILSALNIYDFSDISTGLQPPNLAGAEALTTVPVGQPNASLATKLELYNQISALVAQQQQQQQQARVPTLAELSGPINGQIQVTGILQSGLNTSFNLTGSNWVWGDYKINEVIANGTFTDGVARLQPLRVNLDGSLLAFSGQLSQEQLSGQGRIEALPVALIKPFIPELPVEVTGNLNGLVTLAGSVKNPTGIGEIALVDGNVNNQSIQTAQVSFNYNNARLNFGSNISVTGTGTEPVDIIGSIPLSLPFATVKPDSDQININANVRNEGLAILNALTNQVSWVGGQGNVDIQIGGTLEQPNTTGFVTVKNATLKSPNLSQALTDVTGTIRFAGDRFNVEGLQGKYSQGQLIAAGILPIFATQNALQQAETNPLTVVLENLRLSLPELYTGGVSGNIVIRGTAQTPQLAGNVRLQDGQISITQNAETSQTTGATPANNSLTNSEIFLEKPATTITNTPSNQPRETANSSPPPSSTSINLPVEFANFRVILDNDVRVTQEPLFSFVTQGDIILNGTLANPRPQGVINIKQGQINLFVTRFTLARGHDQTATFTPKQGFDPILNVRLATLVPQYNTSRSPTTPTSSEINDSSPNTLGTFNTIRIEASVQGPASQLSEKLQLTSEPSRTEAEIVALLGGSFINVFGQPDATSIGIATLTNSEIFANFQGRISQLAEAIGLREFQIYPTIQPTGKGESSVLSLAAETAIGISEDISVSVSRVFYGNESFRYNLLYQLSDHLVIRGSTNLTDESRAEIQFEKRF